jgi:hypothetical protein
MDNKPILKELNDHFSKIAPMLLQEDLEHNAMQLFVSEKEAIQNKVKQLNIKAVQSLHLRELENVIL